MKTLIQLSIAFTFLCGGYGTAAAASGLEPIQIGSPKRVVVHPETVELDGPRSRTQLIVTGFYADGSLQDLTRVAEYRSADEGTVQANDSILLPRADGASAVVVSVGDHTVSVPVRVRGQSQPSPVSFQYETLAALSKQGCNSGACHGSPSGKGGFRLSLRAFDPELDKLTLIRESFGRRTNVQQPDASLLLLKPLMRVPHGGGTQLRTSDPSYTVLRDWVAEGCRVDAPETPKCVGIEVYPKSGRLLRRPAHTQQLSVMAHFSDGSARDVTPLAVYSSSDDQVARVDANGFVVGSDRGEAAIIVRYLEFIESSFITFVRDVDGFAWNAPPQHNYIDELVDQKLEQLQYLPSEVCSDAEFIRRVSLDVVGVLPSAAEVRTFLADTRTDKRARFIDGLLERPGYAKFWALKWGDLLRLTSKQVGADGVYKYHRWVERAIADNMPYDEFARQLLTASGSTLTNPPANFYRTADDANDCVETVSQIFLGARLQCAKCHNHPFERWTQDNYYGMAAFFNRVERANTVRPDELFVWVRSQGEVKQPRTGETMKPWLPNSDAQEEGTESDRRELFAEWLTRPDNPFFARIEVNRIWSHLLGRGIVDPPDDFRDSNPPSNAALLDQLARDFADSGFDRKQIIKRILNSRTYQTSFEPNEFNANDTKYFSHYQPRMLSAEQLLDAICQVTAVPERFGSLPAGTKATHLPAPDLTRNEFLKVFGQPERQTACECERSTESNLGMAIQLFNGPLVFNKLRNKQNRFRQLEREGKSDREIVAELHLAAVNRLPTEQEVQSSLQHIAAKDLQIQEVNADLERKMAILQRKIEASEGPVREQLRKEKLGQVPVALQEDLLAALKLDASQRNRVQTYLAEKLGDLLNVTKEEIANALGEDGSKMVESARQELAELAKQVRSPGDLRVEALEDICWAIINTNEFLFQH